MALLNGALGRLTARVARGVDAMVRRRLPEGLPVQEERIRYAALLACPLHFLSTFPYAVLFALFGAWTLSALVLPLCLAYGLSFVLLERGRHEAGVFVLLLAVALSITLFSILLGKESRLEVALFYCTVSPFLFFPSGNLSRILLANLIPALCWLFLEIAGYRLWSPYPLTGLQVELFRFLIMPTSALLLLVPLFFLLRGLARSEARLRDALQEAHRSNAAKSQFLAMVSHELRTPLNGVLGILDLLERSGLGPQAVRELGIARRSGRLLHRIIGDMLDHVHLERGRLLLQPQALDLAEVFRECLRPFEGEARAKGLELRFCEEEGMPRVLADADRIAQVLGNLVGNAIKFTERGSVEVRLAWRPVEAGRVRVVWDVDDTGVGIPEARKAGLFAPFAPLRRQANAEGCGLGLAIALRLVEAMDGEIRQEDRHPVGTRFRVGVTFPVASSGPAPLQEGPGAEGEGFPFRGRVLVVDDVKVNRIVATRMLSSLGFQCDEAEDGKQALAAWTGQCQELILMDLQMPVMDGLEATRAILELADFEEREPPVIVALTANTFEEHREMCRKAGMDAFLGKPLNRGELTRTLEGLLDSRLPHLLGKGA